MEGKREQASTIQDYTQFDSEVYAPMTRSGLHTDSGPDHFNIKSQLTGTLGGEGPDCIKPFPADSSPAQVCWSWRCLWLPV